MTESGNLALARSIFDAWERSDFSRTDWASPEIEFGFGDGPDPQRWTGIAGMAEGWFGFQRSWEILRFEGVEFRELDDEHVLVATGSSAARAGARSSSGRCRRSRHACSESATARSRG